MDTYTVYFEAQSILQIPVLDAEKYSSKPLKWIRYVTSAILGVEGDLFDLGEGHQNINLEENQPICRQLLFTSSLPITFVDPNALDHMKPSQFSTESRIGFREAVMARDGSCVITNWNSISCEAAHLIPHSKGSEYIQALCRWRTGDEEPEIESITDPRNGIFITSTLHSYLSAIAVLKTPNFAMACEDVLPRSNEQNPLFRFTAHYVPPRDNGFPPLNDCRYPLTMHQNWPENWPPEFLWNFIYGVVVFNAYGVNEAAQSLTQELQYYPEGIQTSTERAQKDISRRAQDKLKKVEEQKQERQTRAERRSQDNQDLMDSFDKVFCFWMHNRFGPLGREARAREEAQMLDLEQKHKELKAKEVTKWREDVARGSN